MGAGAMVQAPARSALGKSLATSVFFPDASKLLKGKNGVEGGSFPSLSPLGGAQPLRHSLSCASICGWGTDSHLLKMTLGRSHTGPGARRTWARQQRSTSK